MWVCVLSPHALFARHRVFWHHGTQATEDTRRSEQMSAAEVQIAVLRAELETQRKEAADSMPFFFFFFFFFFFLFVFVSAILRSSVLMDLTGGSAGGQPHSTRVALTTNALSCTPPHHRRFHTPRPVGGAAGSTGSPARILRQLPQQAGGTSRSSVHTTARGATAAASNCICICAK